MKTVRFLVLVVAALAAGGPIAVALAQSYPTRAVEFIIPFAPGGPTDTAIRLIQPVLSANLGQPVVLVNKAGGGGAIGMDGVAKAKPDGYTLAATVRSTLTILPATQPDVPYKISDFAPIGTYALDSQVITVKSGAPWKTLDELIDHVKRNPGKLTYGSAGQGTNSFFTMELLKQAYGLDVAHVPFGGSGPVKNAVLGGHVHVGATALSPVLSVIRSGDLTPLVTSATRRNPAIPTVPTLTDKGQGEIALSTWAELWAPAKTPKPVMDRLVQALDRTMKDPAVVAAIEKAGLQVEYNDPVATQKLVERENEVVRTAARKLRLAK